MSVRRENAVTGELIDLRATFTVGAGGAKFDPDEMRKVDVLNASTGELVVTIGAADIEQIEQGVYQVTIGPFADAVTLNDRWYITPFAGADETVKQFRTEVASWNAAEDLPISKATLLSDYLFGCDLTNDDGTPYPDSLFTTAIKQALAFMERHLDIDIAARDYVGARAERHDYDALEWAQYATFKLDRRPVREIVSVKALYPGSDAPIEFPAAWVQLTIPEAGRFELVPAVGTLAFYLGQQIPLVRAASRQRIFPGLIHVEYRAGFDAVPDDIKHLLSLRASFNVLNPAGDLIAGAGIASKSVSIGGLSQSISTTASATNAGYGSRLIQYEKELKAMIPRIRAYYHGVSLFVV